MAEYTIEHQLEAGIERIIYTPHQQRQQTPILLGHGMWHGAWCWQPWQELLAEWGWQSIAFSLPGHGKSPAQRPYRLNTLGYYYRTLKAEIERLPIKPIYIGHSMGGALGQWHLAKGGDDLPAMVLVAPWLSHSMRPVFRNAQKLDPWGVLLSWLSLSATPTIRTPKRAAFWFLSDNAIIKPKQLHRQLAPESALVLLQYRWPLWRPAKKVKTPLLWLAAEHDRCIPEVYSRPSAAHYNAEYWVIPKANHDLMFEESYRETAELINNWLQSIVTGKQHDHDSNLQFQSSIR
ncbi:alpha/beta hydrolase [Herpetosiphon llansteffanensis]|uniref:alpha/beta hydrolase n=1 Tax=Herpetosiphon llansteffanensis TaxID=2094568 RepID=UPI000D7CE402|nr:alpha/beta fold hydrolase [Herpetosiphon llansteffanensis]